LNEAVLPYGFVGKIHQVILWPRIGFLETLRVTVTGITWNPGGARLRFRLIKDEEVVRDIITPHFMNFPGTSFTQTFDVFVDFPPGIYRWILDLQTYIAIYYYTADTWVGTLEVTREPQHPDEPAPPEPARPAPGWMDVALLVVALMGIMLALELPRILAERIGRREW